MINREEAFRLLQFRRTAGEVPKSFSKLFHRYTGPVLPESFCQSSTFFRGTITDAQGIMTGKDYPEPICCGFGDKLCYRSCKIITARHHQSMKLLAIHPKHLLFPIENRTEILSCLKDIRRKNQEIDLRLRQCPAGKDIALITAGPLALAMVEKTYRRLIFSSIQKMADPVRISHELAEDPVLWIFSMGIEMGRAVRVRKFLR